MIKVVNFSLAKDFVPDGFKNAIVTPLLKGDTMKNYCLMYGWCFFRNFCLGGYVTVN